MRLDQIPPSTFDLIDMHLSLVGEDGRVSAWPDGLPFLEQPVQLTQAFDRITGELNRWRNPPKGNDG